MNSPNSHSGDEFDGRWLEAGRAVPVDIPTTGALVRELQRLREEVRSNVTAASAMLGFPYGLTLPEFCEAVSELRPSAASDIKSPTCVCGNPTTLGVVHRDDGPCFHYVPPPQGDFRGRITTNTTNESATACDAILEACGRQYIQALDNGEHLSDRDKAVNSGVLRCIQAIRALSVQPERKSP